MIRYYNKNDRPYYLNPAYVVSIEPSGSSGHSHVHMSNGQQLMVDNLSMLEIVRKVRELQGDA